MITYPSFPQKQPAVSNAIETARLTGTKRFVVCFAGHYYVRLKHEPGPLANWYMEVMPDGSVREGY